MELALHTHWPRSEILMLETEELLDSVNLARKLSGNMR